MTKISKVLIGLLVCLSFTRAYAASSQELSSLYEYLATCPDADKKIQMIEVIHKQSQQHNEEKASIGHAKVQEAIDDAATKPAPQFTAEWIMQKTTLIMIGSVITLLLVGIISE